MKAAFSALLLAGGASTRMGRPKALLEFEGMPLWRRQARLLQSLGPQELMISAGVDWEVEAGPWTIVRDRAPGMGPLGGLAVALETMAADLLLVLAVDMPGMSAGYLGQLLASAGQGGVVPEENGVYHGLGAVYPRSLGALVGEALAGEDRSVQSVVRRAVREGLVTPRPIAPGEEGLFRNVNRPEDLRPQ
ncbi:MAG TPA: molybdenum cofactor guanylyltransferase [Opitutaceae bacterium]